jgi:hypothetical protein
MREMRGNRVDLKNVPIGAWVFASAALFSVVGGLVVLNLSGANTDDFWRLLNLIFNTVGVVSGTGSLVYAGAAARNSQKAVEQTNGVLGDERQQIARDAAAAAVLQYRKETGN